MVELQYSPNMIFIKSRYQEKDRVASIPGLQWHLKQKVWFGLLTPMVAHGILKEFYRDITDEDTRILMAMSNRVLNVEKIVNGDYDRSLLPDCKVPFWRHQEISYLMTKELLGLNGPPSAPGGGSLLALDMGCGKSAVAAHIIANHPKHLKRVLIVSPFSVMDVWPFQLETHTDNSGMLVRVLNDKTMNNKIIAALKTMDLAEARKKQAVLVINYESSWRPEFARLVYENDFHLIVADEVHRIKSVSGKASKFFEKASHVCSRHLGLTGTPLPHSPMDAFGSFRFIDPGVYGVSYMRFRAKYAIMGGFNNKQVVSYQNEDEFNKRFYSVSYRVLSEEVQDLPEKISVVRTAALDGKEQDLYESMDRDFCALVMDEVITADNALVKLLRLQEITSGFLDQMPIGTTKRRLLYDVLEDIPPDEPVVVFGLFKRDLQVIREVAEEHHRSYAELSGNAHELDVWQRGEANVLGVQIRSGREGVDFTRSKYCIYYSKNFSLGDFLQSQKRIHRPGQKRNCTYIHLVIKNSVDEKILKALENKEEVIESILKQIKQKELIPV